MIKDFFPIIQNKLIQKDIYEMIIHAPKIAKDAKCGQFIHISLGDQSMLLRRPISISQIIDDKIVICYRINGNGTKLLSEKKINEELDIIGPLGNSFPLVNNKKVLLIGGGIGVPPLLELAKKLSKDNILNILLAFKNKDCIIYLEQFKKYGNVILTLDSGEMGFKGNAIDYLNTNQLDFDVLYSCGPSILLQKLDEKYYKQKEGYLSFEERMACGIGACYGCVCHTKDNYKRVCKDGPIFKLGEMVYETKC